MSKEKAKGLPEGLDDDRFVDVDVVVTLLGISVRHFYRLLSEGRFPQPIRSLGRVNRWRLRDVKEWMEREVTRSSFINPF